MRRFGGIYDEEKCCFSCNFRNLVWAICMQKNTQVVLQRDPELANYEDDSDREHVRGNYKESDVVVDRSDNNHNNGGSIVANDNNNNNDTNDHIESQNQFEKKRPLNRPPASAFMEKNQKRMSHPLPTPNLASSSQPLCNINKPVTNNLILPLPKPDEESSSNNNIPQEIAASCRLPMPKSSETSDQSDILPSPYLKAFSLDELKRATSNFNVDSMLGEGGFGCVYKGWLDVRTLTAIKPGSGMPVAIKRLISSSFQGHKEWLSEVNYLGRLRHPSLVKLIGYCIEGEDRILVYEYMPGGSLEAHLFTRRSPCLSWARRIKVAVDAARGLCFLHESKSPVIYRDFKTSNILLDSEFNAKLSDFGLAKTGPTESETHVSTRVMGTEGYCDPSYLATGQLTFKCDVYSFGVVLLEILTGRRAMDDTKCGEERILVDWVRLHILENGKVFRIMDTKLEGQYCKRSAYVAANIALRCVNQEPKYRPPMTDILEILENLPSNKNQHHHHHHKRKIQY